MCVRVCECVCEREVSIMCVRELDEYVSTGDITNLETASQTHRVHILYQNNSCYMICTHTRSKLMFV